MYFKFKPKLISIKGNLLLIQTNDNYDIKLFMQTRHNNLPMGYVRNMDSMMSAVRLYLRPLQPSVSGLMSA